MKKLSLFSISGRAPTLRRSVFATFALVSSLLISSHPAFAQIEAANTMGDMFCNMQFGISDFGNLFMAIAYIAGVALMGQGISLLVRYYDNPNSTPIHQPMTRIAGASALLAAPSVAQSIINTLFDTGGTQGNIACGADAIVTGNGITGLDVLLTNFVDNIKDPLTFLISTAAVVIGVFMIVRGLMKASKYGIDPRENSMPKILSNLVVGALLMVVGQSFDLVLNTLGFGGIVDSSIVGTWKIMGASGLNASAQFKTAVSDAGLFFELVGMIAFVRGWMIIKSASEGSGQATLSQGITHVVGGVLAMNIFGFLQIMDNTFGTNFLA